MSSSQGRVCVVGSINADRFIGLARLPELGETVLGAQLEFSPGGKGLNQAVAAVRSGADVRMCSAMGRDIEAVSLDRTIEEAGLNADYVGQVSVPTGAAYVFSLVGGENSIVVTPGANSKVSLKNVAAAVRDADVVLTQLEINTDAVHEALVRGKEYGATTVLNAAPAHPVVWELLSVTDFLIVNQSEALALGGISALAEQTTVVQTMGSAGVRVHPASAKAYEVPAHSIVPVDTTGAGDAFCGSFSAELAGGGELGEAVRQGCAAGAIIAQVRGAQSSELTRAAMDQLRSRSGTALPASPVK